MYYVLCYIIWTACIYLGKTNVHLSFSGSESGFK